jgi:hypothetical protein
MQCLEVDTTPSPLEVNVRGDFGRYGFSCCGMSSSPLPCHEPSAAARRHVDAAASPILDLVTSSFLTAAVCPHRLRPTWINVRKRRDSFNHFVPKGTNKQGGPPCRVASRAAQNANSLLAQEMSRDYASWSNTLRWSAPRGCRVRGHPPRAGGCTDSSAPTGSASRGRSCAAGSCVRLGPGPLGMAGSAPGICMGWRLLDRSPGPHLRLGPCALGTPPWRARVGGGPLAPALTPLRSLAVSAC